jgi:hypothetical protein
MQQNNDARAKRTRFFYELYRLIGYYCENKIYHKSDALYLLDFEISLEYHNYAW